MDKYEEALEKARAEIDRKLKRLFERMNKTKAL